MVARTDAIDAALLAYMLDGAAPIYGRTKIQKTPFFVEFRLDEIGATASRFPYKRWDRGPFSPEVWNALDLLVDRRFLRDGDFGLTERGLVLVDLIYEIAKLNADQFSAIKETLRYCKTKTGRQLMDAAYEVEVESAGRSGERCKIRDLRKGVRILDPGDRTIVVPDDLAGLIESEISVKRDELEAAEKEANAINREAADRLFDALNASTRA